MRKIIKAIVSASAVVGVAVMPALGLPGVAVSDPLPNSVRCIPVNQTLPRGLTHWCTAIMDDGTVEAFYA